MKTQEIPGGFAGLDRDPRTGRWSIALVDTSQVRGARDALLRWREAGELQALATRRDLELAAPRPAVWSLVQLFGWLDFLTPRVLALDGMRGIGVNERRNMLTVVLRDQQSRAKVEELLATLTVPCDLAAIEIS